ncbi:glycosyltransferase family 2 protein [Angustibacter sp. Root456]|uniref:glycosyltransferase family 2 protein n=1 Tax=Angustibacter sp. Root456 TaxID=1736539 RepID=UPI0007022BF3|nr:glycosyltransferase [Angustibacter sp. Root456]KQX62762.1 glycosyl transferase [Angustibacter sp. Root456]
MPQLATTTVVMTRNRRDELLRTVQRLEGPVIVVDNGSTDGTAGAVASLRRPDVEVLALGRNRGAVARTIGAARARTPLVAFADDDSWWHPGALAVAAEAFAQHPRLGLLAAQVRVGDDERVDAVSAAMASAPLGQAADLPGPDVLGFIACAAVVRREAFLGVGGFDDVVFFAGEEERVALDLASSGWGLAYVGDVVAHHLPSPVRSTPVARQALIERNLVLTALMRRPWPVVRERWAARSAARQEGWGTLSRRAGRALARRHVVPPHVEARARLLERGLSTPTVGIDYP